jgi:hypothetical protein
MKEIQNYVQNTGNNKMSCNKDITEMKTNKMH